MDLDRITNPLRLARGSHQPGSGKGCAMNVISYINGDEEISDFPATSARPLASFVQLCNDLLAGPDGYLSPENSLLMFLALKKEKVPAEMHIYASGGHGFGLRPSDKPCSQWPQRCADWMKAQGLLKK